MTGMASDRRGFVAPMTGLVMALLIGFVGLAVDTTRAWVVEARMKTALDAAALLAARRFTQGTRDAEATSLFWANVRQTSQTASPLGGVISNLTITPVTGQGTTVRVSARASTPTTFFNVIQAQSIVRDDFAVARRGQGLELVIIIDNTSSMNANVASLGITKLQAAKNAATRLVNLLYGCTESAPNSNVWSNCNETQTNLFVSVVGFTRNLNIGTGANSAVNTTMVTLDTTGFSTTPGLEGWTSNMFYGCVRARPDFTDAAPTGSNQLRPYAAPSTFRRVGEVPSSGSTPCSTTNAYAAVNVPNSSPPRTARYCFGDNDWVATGATPAANWTTTRVAAHYGQASTDTPLTTDMRNRGVPGALASGPNMFCTPSPMIPLTARRTGVIAGINALTAFDFSGGTIIAPALQGAWWALSPNWRGYWADPNTGLLNIPPLPRDYDLADNVKAIVILSDGDNNWYGASSYNVRSAPAGDLLFSAYGRATTNWNSEMSGVQATNPGATPPGSATTANLGTIDPSNGGSVDNRLNSAFLGLCNAIRNPQANALDRIRLYVVGFEVGSGTTQQTMLTNCASLINGTQRLYYNATDATQLNSTFEQIAADLNRTRLIQ